MIASTHRDLFVLLSLIKSPKNAQRLCADLLSPAEVDNIAQRWQIMQQVAAGRSHRTIAKSVGTSIAKVSRCARVVRHGNGAIIDCLKKLGKPTKAHRR